MTTSPPDDDDPTSRQVGIALRFIDRLAALSPEQRVTIQNTQDPDAYVATVQQVRAVLDRTEAEYRFEHPRAVAAPSPSERTTIWTRSAP
jgi:hypothetical protein